MSNNQGSPTRIQRPPRIQQYQIYFKSRWYWEIEREIQTIRGTENFAAGKWDVFGRSAHCPTPPKVARFEMV